MNKSKKLGIATLAGGLALGALASVGFHNYYSKPSSNLDEFRILSATSGYLQDYNGPNIEQALEYAGLTLNISLESKNPKIPANELKDLKSKVDEEIESLYVPDEILMSFKPGVGKADQDNLLQDYGLNEIDEIPQIGVKVLKVDPEVRDAWIKILSHNPNVDFAEKDPIGYVADYPPKLQSLGNEMENFVERNSRKGAEDWFSAALAASVLSCYSFCVSGVNFYRSKKTK